MILHRAKEAATTLIMDSRASERMAVESVIEKATNFTTISPRPMAREAEMAMRRCLRWGVAEKFIGVRFFKISPYGLSIIKIIFFFCVSTPNLPGGHLFILLPQVNEKRLPQKLAYQDNPAVLLGGKHLQVKIFFRKPASAGSIPWMAPAGCRDAADRRL